MIKLTLVMEEREAEALCQLAGMICGKSKNTPREFFDKIYYALKGQGVDRGSRMYFLGSLPEAVSEWPGGESSPRIICQRLDGDSKS